MKFAIFALATFVLYVQAAPTTTIPVTQDPPPYLNGPTSYWARRAAVGVDAEAPFANSGNSRWVRRVEEGDVVEERGIRSIPTEPTGYLNGPTSYWARSGEEDVNVEEEYVDTASARWV